MIDLPVGFRLTCYYYRKAYYRSFAVARRPAPWPTRTRIATAASPGSSLILQNLHRYALLVPLIFNSSSADLRRRHGPGCHARARVDSVGLARPARERACSCWLYPFGCHACRHFCGGR